MCGAGGGRARCAMCGAGADVHCADDRAFLCCACDGEVHGNNLVAARHRRTRVSASLPPAAASSCVPTADSATAMATAAMEGWARRMGVAAVTASRSAAAAGRALRVEVAPVAPRMPLRLGMAAVLWREMAPHCAGVHRVADALRQLEASARVPARLVVAVASLMGRSRGRKRTVVLLVLSK